MLRRIGLLDSCANQVCCAAQAHFFLGQALLEDCEAELLSAVHHLSKARPRATQLLSGQYTTVAISTLSAWQQSSISVCKAQSVCAILAVYSHCTRVRRHWTWPGRVATL